MMRRMMTERGRWMLAVVLVGSLLTMFAGALPVVADDPPNPVRTLPATVAPGEEFEVTVSFTAPADNFNDIRLNDMAPAGWTVTIDPAWVTPTPTEASSPETNEAQFWWSGDWAEDTAFTASYRVLVRADAEPGGHTFSGTLSYRIGEDDPLYQPIGGQVGLLVESPTSEVSLRARTPVATGCIGLIKIFDPDDTAFPHDQIEVRVSGPEDFDRTYTLRKGEGWEKAVCDIPLGEYTVEELTAVPGWITSYDPPDRVLTVTEGTEPGPDAWMTIINESSIVGISVSPDEIDFGEITPGETKAGTDITVTNIGSVAIDVHAELEEDTVYNDLEDHFYTDALRLAGEAASGITGDDLGTWTAGQLGLESVESGDSEDVTTALVCPAEMYPDTEYIGTLVFWAVESGG